MTTRVPTAIRTLPQRSTLVAHVIKHRYLYLLLVPGILFYFLFKYLPMYGIIIAFKHFTPVKGIMGSPWIGLENFTRLLQARDFPLIFRNTLLIGFYQLAFGFPVPIILALLLNEVGYSPFKRSVQTIIYLPHFISWIVVAGLVFRLTTVDGGLVNEVIKAFGGEPIIFLASKSHFRGLLVISDIWKSSGWRTIIFLAALSTVDPTLYESAVIDGANRWQQTWRITLPSIAEVIAILLILQVGDILRVGFQQVIAMYNPAVYEVADIFQTYVYRTGLLQGQFGYATAVGLFNSVIALALVLVANWGATRLGTDGLF